MYASLLFSGSLYYYYDYFATNMRFYSLAYSIVALQVFTLSFQFSN